MKYFKDDVCGFSLMGVAVVLWVILTITTCAEADTKVLVHLGSKHINAKDGQVREGGGSYNEFNPGIGVELDHPYTRMYATGGVYYNSIEKISVNLGAGYRFTPWLGVEAGGVTGYYNPVQPYVGGVLWIGPAKVVALPPTKNSPLTIGISVRF